MDNVFHEYQKILVPVDGSHQSEAALKKGITAAKRNHAELTILHVIDVRAFQGTGTVDPLITKEAAHRANQLLNGYQKEAQEMGVSTVHTRIEYGSPKNVITYEVPEDEKTDLIMMGATGLSAIERLLIGSVSEYVTRHAPCDVMIVRTNLVNHPL